VNYLEGRCLLTTRLHVVPYNAVQVGVKATVCLKPDAVADKYLDSAEVNASVVEYLNDTNWDDLPDEVKSKLNVAKIDHPSVVVLKQNEEWLITTKTRDQTQTYTIRV